MELPENIQAWVDALRSGKYTQQKGTLKGPNGYCCLGVYCSIMGMEPEKSNVFTDGSPVDEGDWRLYVFCRDKIDEDVVDSGMEMNDNGDSFKEIADMIERHYLAMGEEKCS